MKFNVLGKHLQHVHLSSIYSVRLSSSSSWSSVEGTCIIHATILGTCRYNGTQFVLQIAYTQIRNIWVRKLKVKWNFLNEFSQRWWTLQILFAFLWFVSHSDIFLIKWFRMHAKYLRIFHLRHKASLLLRFVYPQAVVIICDDKFCTTTTTTTMVLVPFWKRKRAFVLVSIFGKFICGIRGIVSGIFTFSVVACIQHDNFRVKIFYTHRERIVNAGFYSLIFPPLRKLGVLNFKLNHVNI